MLLLAGVAAAALGSTVLFLLLGGRRAWTFFGAAAVLTAAVHGALLLLFDAAWWRRVMDALDPAWPGRGDLLAALPFLATTFVIASPVIRLLTRRGSGKEGGRCDPRCP
jgi:hypothetical protein